MSPEGIYFWMSEVHGAKTPLWLGFLQRNLVAVFWTVGQQLLLVGKTKGHLGRSVGPFPENLYSGDYCASPPHFVLLQVKVREV